MEYSTLPESFENLAEHEIGMNEFYMGTDRQKLFTEGVSSCIVVAAHNTETGETALGHFGAVTEDNRYGQHSAQQFSECLHALADTPNPSATKIVLLGGAPHIKNETDTTEPDRTYITEHVVEFAKQHDLANDSVVIDWSPIGTVINVELSGSGVISSHFEENSIAATPNKKVGYRV